MLPLLLLVSCGIFSPESRMNRICKNNPTICEYEKIDTQVVIREYSELDTQKITNKVDSFIIHKDRVTTKVYRNYDTIFVRQETEPDTLYNITKEMTQIVKEAPEFMWWIIVGLSLMLATIIIARRK